MVFLQTETAAARFVARHTFPPFRHFPAVQAPLQADAPAVLTWQENLEIANWIISRHV
jgi:hypothetical protein